MTTGVKVHWNYFIAMERNLEDISRYIEFHNDNFQTYSIELAHLFLAAASEVDVIAKLVCKQMGNTQAGNLVFDSGRYTKPREPRQYNDTALLAKACSAYKIRLFL